MDKKSDVREQGFTLIEILLVLVIMVGLSSIIAPSFFQATGASVAGEARYMQKILRLVSEEAQMTGQMIRCSVYEDHLLFEGLNQDGEWNEIQDKTFKPKIPMYPVIIQSAHLNGGIGTDNNLPDQGQKNAMACFTFWPDGRVSAGTVTLAIEGGDVQVIELRSGHGGIQVQKP